MGDDQRRERRTFEPPPWEREAFEALAAKRAEQEKGEQERAEALTRGAMALDELIGSVVAPAATTVEELGAIAAGALRAKAEEDAVAEAEKAAKPDDKAVAAMMLELSQVETADHGGAKVVAWVASGVTAVLGIAMMIAGLALATKAAGKASGLLGSAVMTVFGLVFLGMAVWVWISTNRVRGR